MLRQIDTARYARLATLRFDRLLGLNHAKKLSGFVLCRLPKPAGDEMLENVHYQQLIPLTGLSTLLESILSELSTEISSLAANFSETIL